MPNETVGRDPGPTNPAPRRAIWPWLAGGAVAIAVVGVLLGGVLGQPGATPVDVAAAASVSPSAIPAGSLDPDASGGLPSHDATPTGDAIPSGPAPTDDGSAPAPPTPGATAPVPATTPSASPLPTLAPEDPDGIPAARMQRRIDTLRKKLGIPGVSVAVVWDDGRQWLGASGWANVRAREPMTTGTAFALASVSKTYTAAVILQLVEEGALSLDTKVAKLLPGYGLHPRMTVRQLLDHTSGLPDYFLNAKIDRPLQADPTATWSAEQTWRYVRKKRPNPGNLWIYSNANYLLLGKLVEQVTGNPLAVEIRSRLLDPLGLENTWYQAVEEPRVEGAVGYRILPKAGGGVRFVAVAPQSDVMPFRSVVTAADGAGSLAATALDAARWMQAYAGGDVITGETHREQVTDALATLKLGARIPYGLGIQAQSVAGHRALGHSGRFLGFRNEVRYFPDDGVAIAVLTNQGVWDPGRFERAMLNIIAPDEEPVPAEPSASPSAQP